MTAIDEPTATLDVSDLDRHMGVPIRAGELKEDVAVGDIRRWVQAMHYPNPLHYDEDWAAASRFGHHTRPPRSRASAGTSSERTTSVSSRTPKATMNAICCRNSSGSVASAPKVAASTTPALVMTPPVTARPVSTPVRVPRSSDSSLRMRKAV